MITGCDEGDWYDELVGKEMKVKMFRDDPRAHSISLPGNCIKNGHFRITKGKDPRTHEARKKKS